MAGDEQSKSDEKAAKKARKDALKKEADTLGISYEELKKQKKERKKKREADQLQDGEHESELKRMRTWSKDYDEDPSVKKRRTRSMDKAEEEKEQESISPEAWRREHGIKVQGHGAHQSAVDFADPFLKFTDTPYCPAIIKAFQQAGFDAPTHIQSQAWPIAIKGQDMICIAKTGSGKTLGFLLPALHQHLGNRQSIKRGQVTSPVLLVLAPTRELAVQIMEEAQKFGRVLGIRSVCCYGGAPKYPQIAALSRGVECVIATPGRLNDLLEMK
jgi:ATP-dependent RNA helicase DDX5/DBP2